MEYKLLYSPEKLSSIKAYDEDGASFQPKWEVGNIIDNKYEIQEILAEDNNKIIFKVRHCQWNIPLAVRSQLKEEDQIQFFEQAERWVALEKHPNIASAYYVKNYGGIPRLFVEYVRAQTLKEHMQNASLDVEIILDIAIQLGWGMSHAHSKGLLHGDLRPGNIFITDDYQLKISDFRSREKITLYSAYMAPEQLTSDVPIHYTIDIYSYGVILYELCLGKLPFDIPEEGLSTNTIEKFRNTIMTEAPIPIYQVRSEIPKELSSIVMSCLSVDSKERIFDFNQINENLSNLYENLTGFKYPRRAPVCDALIAIDFNNRALSLLDLGEDEKAEEYLEQAVVKDPECTGAVVNLELLKLRKNKNSLSAMLGKTYFLLDLDPQVVCYYRAKICLEYGGFLEEALGEVCYILDRYPRNKELQNLKASFFERLGMYEEAAEIFASSVENEVPNIHDFYELGKCYFFMTKFKSAQQTFEKGVALFPDNTALQLGLGIAMAQRGRVKEAQEHFQKMVAHKEEFWPMLHLAEITGAVNRYVKAYGKATPSIEEAKTFYQKLWKIGSISRVRYGYEVIHASPPPQARGKFAENMSHWRYTGCFEDVEKGLHCVALSQDNRFAITGGDDPNLRIWELATGKCKNVFETKNEKIIDVRISRDGHFLISIGNRNIVDVWDLVSGESVCKLEGHVLQTTCLELTKTGYIATGSVDKTIRIWDLGGLVCYKVLKGHKDKILCLAVTPDNTKLISGSEDKNIGVWDIESGACLAMLQGHTEGINCITVAPNGKYVVSGSWDQKLRIWDMKTKQCIKVLEQHTGLVNCIVITPDSERIISGAEDKNICIWDAQTGECINVLEGHTVNVTCLALAPQSQTIISGSWDHTIRMWDLETGKCLNCFENHTDLINALAITHDESYILSGGDDCALRIYKDVTMEVCPPYKETPLSYLLERPKLQNTGNILEQRLINKLYVKAQKHIADGEVARSFELFREIQEMKEFENNNRILESIANTAIQNNFKRKKTRKIWGGKTLQAHENRIQCICYIEKENLLAVASHDGCISIWNLENGKQIEFLRGHNLPITCMAVSPNNRFIVSGSRDNTLRLWELHTGQCIYALEQHTHWVESVRFSSDNRQIISASRDGKIIVWNIKTGDPIHSLSNHTDMVTCIEVVGDDDTYLVSGSHDRSIRVWNLEDGSCLHTLERHHEHIKCIEKIPNTEMVLSTGWDQVIYMWDITKGSFEKKFTGHTSWVNSLAVSSDSKTIVSVSLDNSVRVWDIESGECKAVFTEHVDDINQILITPDNRFAISGANDGNVLIWDLQKYRCCDGFHAHESPITCLLLIQDGRRLISGSKNGNIIVWEIDWEWEIPYEYEQRREQKEALEALENLGL